MKKQLAAVLSACMVIGSGAGAVPVKAEEYPDTYIHNEAEEEIPGSLQETEEEQQSGSITEENENGEPETDGITPGGENQTPEAGEEDTEPDQDGIVPDEEDSGEDSAVPDEAGTGDIVPEAVPAAENDSTSDGELPADSRAELVQQIIDGKKYMVYPDGTHYTGWYDMTEDWRLYFDPEADGAAAVGLTQIGGEKYLFDASGVIYRGPGTPVIDGSKYFIRDDGSLGTGWITLGSWKMYFDPETGKANTGLSEAEGKLYLFTESGVLREESGTPVIDGKKYWMNTDSSLGTGWKQLGSWKMYFDEETGEARTGLSEVDGSYYLFDGGGVLREGSGIPVIDGKKYWMNSDSSLNFGWLDMGAIEMYFDPATFQAATGVTVIDGGKYAFDSNGALLKGSGTPVINGKKYCFNEDGTVNTGWFTLGDWTFYFDPQTGAAAVGIVTIDGEQYFFDAQGVKQPWMATKAEQYAYDTLNRIGWDLRAAYDWAASMPYYRMSADVVPAGADPTEWYAEFGFTKNTGNCYVMASTFYYMARLLGYDVHRVNGYVPISPTAYNPHGWCEIDMNGTTYVFDPNFTNEMHRNGYQITYGTSGTWMYSFYSRIN